MTRPTMPALLLLGLLGLTACSRITVEPARYSCTPGGAVSQCPGEWRCIGEGFCVDPAAGGSWACAREEDCTGGWHCGAEGRCYDRADAGALSCRRDAGVEDCAPGWTCGLESRCLRTTVGGFNRCDLDGDCFGGQRCAAGRCIDVGTDGLRADATTPTLSRGTSPFTGARLAASAQAGNQRLLVAVVGQDLVVLDTLGERAAGTRSAGVARYPLGALDPRDLAVVEGDDAGWQAVLVNPDGGLTRVTLADGTQAPQRLPFAVRGVHRFQDPNLRVGLFGDHGVAVGESLDRLYTLATPDAGEVRDLVGFAGQAFIVSTASGGWVHEFDKTGAFVDAGWTATLCDETGPLPDLRLVRTVTAVNSVSDPELIAVVSNGSTSRALRYANRMGTSACPLSLPGLTLDLVETSTPFPVAAPTAVLADVGARSRVAVGGRLADGTHGLAWETSTDPTAFIASTNGTSLLSLDADGRALVQPEGLFTVEGWMPLGFPRASFGGRAILDELPKTLGNVTPQTLINECVVEREGSWCVPFRLLPIGARAIREHDDWFGWTESESSNGSSLATVGSLDGAGIASQAVSTPSAPLVGATTGLPDGGTLLVTGALDYLSWAEVEDSVSVQPRLAVSPLPRGDITDVILMPSGPATAPDARFAEGWVLSSGRVFRVFASTRALWRSTEVVLPTDVEVVRVWRDGDRPRAGDARGVVFAPRLALALSEPLPEGQRVRDFASRCHHDFALSDQGRTWQLVPGADGLGTWREVVTPFPLTRLLDDGAQLRGFDDRGFVWWFDDLRCD